jgi:hypothetical protein
MTYPTKKLGEDCVWNKGDILAGADRRREAALHYIIALESYHRGNFLGAMLTSKDTYAENIPLRPEHIRTHAHDGSEFKIQHKNSHFVRGKFIKLEGWGPFKKVGELTEEGMALVESETKGLVSELWDDYVARAQRP